MVVSGSDLGGRPIGFGALSGLAAEPGRPDILYAVNDSVYPMQPTIFTIDAQQKPARIVKATRVTRGGAPAQLLDLEGIAADGEGVFWLASEGYLSRMVMHGLVHVRSEEHTSELQSLMRISYSVFCLKKKNHKQRNKYT